MTPMTPTITIRPALAADAPTLSALLVAQLREHDIPTPEAHVAATVAALIKDPERGFILAAEADGAVAGVAYVSFATPLEHVGESAWLEELYVSPAHRNMGVGDKLVEAVITRCEARGCVSLDLEVDVDHGRATHLYQRKGFRPMTRAHWVRPLAKWDW